MIIQKFARAKHGTSTREKLRPGRKLKLARVRQRKQLLGGLNIA